MTKSSQSEFAPIGDADWPDDLADMRTGFAGGLNVYRVMAHHPALLKAWANLREHVVNQSSLGRQQSEVVILRTGYCLGSTYEWHHHIVRARAAGLDDARIACLNGPIDRVHEHDALLAKSVDELLENHRISEPTEGRLRLVVGKHGVLDLIATVGFYSTLGFMLNTFDTQIDQNIADALRNNPLSRTSS